VKDPRKDVPPEGVRAKQVRGGGRLKALVGMRSQWVDRVEERDDQGQGERQHDDDEPCRRELVLTHCDHDPFPAAQLERLQIERLENVGGLSSNCHQPSLTRGSITA
jgi:hypothetical protein